MPVPGSELKGVPSGSPGGSITAYIASGPTIPQAVAGIRISHALMRAETNFAVIPPQLHRCLDDGVPLMIFGRQGYVEAAKVNLANMHADLQFRDIVIYVRPVNPMTALPGVFLIRSCSIMTRAEKFRQATVQVVVTEEAAIAASDEIPFPVVQWFLQKSTTDTDVKGVLLIGDWPSLAGHLHNLLVNPPEVVLAHSGALPTADVKARIVTCISDAIPAPLAAAFQNDMVQCVATGMATWIHIEEESWRKERVARELHEAQKRKQKADAQREREAAKAAKPAAPAKPAKTKKTKPAESQEAPAPPAVPTAAAPATQTQVISSDEEAEEEEEELSDFEATPATQQSVTPTPQGTRPNTPVSHDEEEEEDVPLSARVVGASQASEGAMQPPKQRAPKTPAAPALPRRLTRPRGEAPRRETLPEESSEAVSSTTVRGPRVKKSAVRVQAPSDPTLGSLVQTQLEAAAESERRRRKRKHDE